MSSSRELDRSRQSIMRVNPQRDSTERKNRKALSCGPCRRRKVKCDRSSPCNQCIRHKTTESCQYTPRAPHVAHGADPQAIAVSSISEQSPPPQGASAPSPQRPGPGFMAACTSDHNGSNRDASDSPRNLPSLPASTLGMDPMVQSLGQSSFPGSGERTRFFGRSHWALTVDMFPDLRHHLRKYHEAKQSNAHSEFSEYLSMRQSKQSMRQDPRYRTHIQPSPEPPSLKALIPDRPLTDHLVGLYFSSFETTFRILHRVRFLEEYNQFCQSVGGTSVSSAWSDEVFAAKLLSLMACASCFASNQTGSGKDNLHLPNKTAKEWIQAVVSWVKLLTNNAKLSLDIIQIECLLLLAQQAVGHEGDFSWSASGSLVRNAIMIGLHRDPSHYKAMSPYWGEMRRRLWATIVELDLQAALSLGAPVSISHGEYDCRPPSNLDDEDLEFDAPTSPTPKPRGDLTRTSFLAILAETFTTRARIASSINNVRVTSDYSEVLELSETLTNHISNLPPALRDESSSGSPGFRKSLLLFLIYRSLLALHRPYFLSLSESGSKIYSYSQKICVQASLAMLSPLASFIGSPQHRDELMNELYYLHLKGGMFRDELFHAAATLCFEIRLQSKESVLLPVLGANLGGSEQYGQNNLDGLFQTVEHCLNYFEMKVRTEKQASKSFMLLHMFYASSKHAFLHENHRQQASNEMNDDYYTLEKACPRASKRCRELLLHGVTMPSSEDAQLGQGANLNAAEMGYQLQTAYGDPQQSYDVPVSFNQPMAPFQTGEIGPELYVSVQILDLAESTSNH
ncbi:unnamed protein product [Penicillium salamii]|nr:unnamed protein product [Penicillium salamii]